MRTLIPIASVLVCACLLDAQIVDRVNRLPDGSDQVLLRNSSTKTLVAFVLSVKHVSPNPNTDFPDGQMVVFYDPLVDATAPPIQSAEERVVANCDHLPPDSFRRGTRLIVRRSNMLQAVETVIALLSNAGGHNIPRSQLVGEFQTLADSLNLCYLPLEQQVGRGLNQSIVGKLVNLPEQQFGAPFPPTDFVVQQLSSLNQQRVRLLSSEPSLQEAAVLIGR